MSNLSQIHTLIFFVLVTISSFGQISDSYYKYENIADSLFKIQKYEEASENFIRMYELKTPKGVGDFQRYKAAQAFAMSNKVDLSFEQLLYIAQGKRHFLYIYTPTKEDLVENSLLENLTKDTRWKELLKLTEAINEEVESKLDSTLIKESELIFERDQEYRGLLYEAIDQYGRDSKEVTNLDSLQALNDSINLVKLDSIVSIHGWPGIDIIGFSGSHRISLIIKHSSFAIQDKYVPLIKNAFSKGNFIPGDYIMIMDAYSLHKNGTQIYGSQDCYDSENDEYYLCPLTDPDNINERRFTIGLSSIQSDLKRRGIVFDLEEYKRNLPELKAAYKRDLEKFAH